MSGFRTVIDNPEFACLSVVHNSGESSTFCVTAVFANSLAPPYPGHQSFIQIQIGMFGQSVYCSLE